VEARFCCYGCLLAAQVTRARGEHGAATAILVRLGLAIFFAMNVMMLSMPTYVPYVYGRAAAPSDGPLFQLLRVLALIFAAPVVVLLGWPLAAGAVRGLRGGVANTDLLIGLGAGAAYVLSVVNTVTGAAAVYFDTASMLLVLVTLGRYLEAKAKADAGAALRATLAPGPQVAVRVGTTSVVGAGDVVQVAASQAENVAPAALLPGDVVRVGPGDAFPTDGIVVDGTGGVDEAVLTGESRLILKRPGSEVASATCSVDGLFLVRVTARAADSAGARVSALLAAARRERAAAERRADRVAAALVPLVVAVAAGAGIFWSWHVGVDRGVLTALAVLVVACPCGLGIATPVAVWTGLVTAARHGVIVRSAAALERAGSIDHVLFDKTGTLTERTPQLAGIESAPGVPLSSDELLRSVAALEAGLTHPFARAVTAAWQSRQGAGCVPPLRADAVQVMPGRGIRGRVNGEPVAVGSANFAAEELGAGAAAPVAHGQTDGPLMFVWQPARLLGTLRFAEVARPDAAIAIRKLEQIGVQVGLLSGDTCATAIVPRLVSPEHAALGLLPEGKLAYLRALREQPRNGRTRGALAMVGDGVNDAPALAAADLGVAVGTASDLARMTADVAIVSDDLDRVPWLIAYARHVDRVVRQNLFWVFAYNAVAVALAAQGALNPLIASVAMLASSLTVVANARRLRHG
jgi:heavy metal translocating P-type ATPase